MRRALTLSELKDKKDVTRSEIIRMVWNMSIPAILSQITFIAMQYIDAAMVGSLGADASASVGLVSSASWLIFGISMASTVGFSILVGQKIGAEDYVKARSLTHQAFTVNAIVAIVMLIFGILISNKVPVWMGGNESIATNASAYFMVLMFSIPFFLLRILSSSIVQATGNMKVPSITSASTCILDIFFNFFFIFPSRTYDLSLINIYIPGFGLGVPGAALGTVVAEGITSFFISFYLLNNSDLKIKKNEKWSFAGKDILSALKLGIPVGIENAVMTAAMVATTRIIAPLGNVALSANIFAIEAEGLCYMPGYGIAAAITPIISQYIGAKRYDLVKKCSKYGIIFGAMIMGICGIIMFFICPVIFMLFTPDPEVRELGVRILRIEMLAEPMFGISIVTAAVLRGAGDTLIPSMLNAASIWGIRISLCLMLVPMYGLIGAWIAMCIELCCRGLIILIRYLYSPWNRQKNIIHNSN